MALWTRGQGSARPGVTERGACLSCGHGVAEPLAPAYRVHDSQLAQHLAAILSSRDRHLARLPGGCLAGGPRPDPPQWGAAKRWRPAQSFQSRQSRGGRETDETDETEQTSRVLHERLPCSRNRQLLPVGPGAGCPKAPGRPWGVRGGSGPFRAGSAVISAAVSMACESEKSDALRWRTSEVKGIARPRIPRIQICSQSPVYGQ